MGLWDQRKLIHLAILKLLVLDVGPDCLLVTPHRRNEIPACPELMPGKIFRFSFDILRDPNRAFALDEADHLGNRVLGSPCGIRDSPWRSFSATHANVELPLVAPAELEA